MKQTKIDELITAWQKYFRTVDDWQALTENVQPKATGCGPVFELGNVIDQPNQSVAIADMREIPYATPHYHTNGEIEIYFVLEGAGQVIVGGEIKDVEKGAVVVTPTDTGHFVIPKEGLVLAVVNTPPFSPSNSVDLTEANLGVGYDHEQFLKLVSSKK